MRGFVTHAKAIDTNLDLSPAVWQAFGESLFNPCMAVTQYDNFVDFPDLAAGTVADGHRYTHYLNTDMLLSAYDSIRGGVELSVNDSDDDAHELKWHGSPFKINTANKLLAFECKIKKASIADESLAFFVGLTAPGVVSDHGHLGISEGDLDAPNKNSVGFLCGTTLGGGTTFEGEKVHFSWKAVGHTGKELINEAATLVADTYIKLGFVFNPSFAADRLIQVYVNGVRNSTFVTKAQIDAVSGAAGDFPSDLQLGMVWASVVGATAEVKTQMEWWCCSQLI